MDAFFIQGWRFEPSRNQASRDKQKYTFSDKSLALIQALALARGEAVSRDVLLSSLWAGRVVTDDSLTNLVSVTRNQLKEMGLDGVIKTLPKRGYCLGVEVGFADSQVSSQPNQINLQNRQAQPVSQIPKVRRGMMAAAVLLALVLIWVGWETEISESSHPKLAILPTQGDSSDEISLVFAESLLNELQHAAVGTDSLNVVSRQASEKVAASAVSAQKIAQQLGADYLVESRVQKQGNQVNLNIQLISGTDGTAHLSRSYEAIHRQADIDLSETIQVLSRLTLIEIDHFLRTDEQDASERESAICRGYLDLFYIYDALYLTNLNVAKPHAISACENTTKLSPGIAANWLQLGDLYLTLTVVTRNDDGLTQSYIQLGENAAQEYASREGNRVDVAELIAGLSIQKMLAPDFSLEQHQQLYKQLGELVAPFLNSDKLTADLANRLGVFWHVYATNQMRNGLDPMPALEQALNTVDLARQRFKTNTKLTHTKGRILKKWSRHLIKVGENPTEVLLSAIALYQSAIASEQYYPVYHDNLANAYSTLAKWLAEHDMDFQPYLEKAEQAYQDAFTYSGRFRQNYNNVADMYAGIAITANINQATFEDYVNKGVIAAKKALEIKPDYVWPYFNLGMLYDVKSQADFATYSNSFESMLLCEQFFDSALALRPRNASGMTLRVKCALRRAWILMEQGEHAQALSLVSQQQHLLEAAEGIDAKLSELFSVKAESISMRALIIKSWPSSADDSTPASTQGIDFAQRAIQLKPDSRDAHVRLLETMLAVAFVNAPESVLSSDWLHKHGDADAYAEAINEFALKFPQDPRLHYLAGFLNNSQHAKSRSEELGFRDSRTLLETKRKIEFMRISSTILTASR